jgi:two-component system NtrC family sensor kinase
MARPTTMKVLDTGMAKEYAIPIRDVNGRITSVLYGGRIINQDYDLVDRIKSIVFGQEVYDSKPVGTVTIFQDDVRISTNVLTQEGRRAIGTRVSDQVYQWVVEQGKTWWDRAFVVTDWYVTAYEPINDIEGKIVGILYVGLLEKPFTDMSRQVLLLIVLVLVLAAVLGAVLSFILAGSISRPLTHMLDATQRISKGDLGHIITAEASITELHELARAFNEMSARLEEREMNLQISKQKLEESNKSYLELIGFVR